MSKNLKDIFETGRKRLDELAEKRKELLERCAALKNGAGEQRLQESKRRLELVETKANEQLQTQIQSMQEKHREAIVQILAYNEQHLLHIKEDLDFRVSQLTREFLYQQEWHGELSTDRVGQSLVPLQNGFRSATTETRTTVDTALNELDAAARKARAVLSEERERSSSGLAGNIKEAQDTLTVAIGEVTKELQDGAAQLAETAKTEHATQLKTLKSVCAQIEGQLIKISSEQPTAIQTIRQEIETELKQRFDNVCAASEQELAEMEKERQAEFEVARKKSVEAPAKTLATLKEQTAEAVDKLSQLLATTEQELREKGDKTSSETRKRYDDAMQAKAMEFSSDSAKALLEEMSGDMEKMSNELNKQLTNSVQVYKTRFATLLHTSEKNLSVSLDSLKFEVDRVLEMHRSTFEEKDKQLNSRLTALEAQYAKIMAGMADN
ncbi:MAG: hypothetical protein K2W95_32535 [Candidatus Obscuribacterales bacterium]|nr:hypothetical protein [Candidatus Obscuribacterales bacterium]